MYTAQGYLVCDRTVKEQFVSEKPNSTVPKSNGTAIIDTAIEQNYCNISVINDPKTGKMSYTLRKDCSDPQA